MTNRTNPMTTDAMLKLATRCEQATGPDRETDLAIHTAVTSFEPRVGGMGWPKGALIVPTFPGWQMLPAYTASLDAAMTLIEPDVFFHVSRFSPESDGRGQAHVYPNRGLGDDYEAEAATPALALCAAALKARASQ